MDQSIHPNPDDINLFFQLLTTIQSVSWKPTVNPKINSICVLPISLNLIFWYSLHQWLLMQLARQAVSQSDGGQLKRCAHNCYECGGSIGCRKKEMFWFWFWSWCTKSLWGCLRGIDDDRGVKTKWAMCRLGYNKWDVLYKFKWNEWKLEQWVDEKILPRKHTIKIQLLS